MKIAVYTIAKNEANYVYDFMESVQEADYVSILDTGSEDATLRNLKMWAVDHNWNICNYYEPDNFMGDCGESCGKTIFLDQKIITPFSFDTARNFSLEMIPDDADVCCIMDMDFIIDPGWRNEVEKSVVNLHDYFLLVSLSDGSTTRELVFAHPRFGASWKGSLHEGILRNNGNKLQEVENLAIKVKHLRPYNYMNEDGTTKYHTLALDALKQHPNDPHYMYLMSRELLFEKDYDGVINQLLNYFTYTNYKFDAEKEAAARFLGEAYEKLGDINNAKIWYTRALVEMPNEELSCVVMGEFLYRIQDMFGCIYFLEQALCIRNLVEEGKIRNYYNNSLPKSNGLLDYLSAAYYYSGNYQKALKYWEQFKPYCTGETLTRIEANILFLKSKL